MKLDQLRKIIREEVRAAVKEELQEMLTEAVRVASKPDANPGFKPAPAPGTSDWSAAKPKMNKKELAEMIGLKTPPKPTNIEFTKNSKIQEALSQTQASMTGEDITNIFGGTSDMVKKPNFASRVANEMTVSSGNEPGIDLSSIPGLSKAKAIFDRANEKQAARL